MRKSILFILLICLCSYITHATKRALIVAIGNYPNSKLNGWSKISSIRDAILINDALQKQGFLSEDITLLSDEQATPDGLSLALDRLKDESILGDVVFIHISSHGVQVQDDNGDEEDLLDECIVTYNAQYNLSGKGIANEFVRSADVSGSLKNYYRDDLFGEHIGGIRKKLGKKGDVLVLMDLCHAGSGTRGWENAKRRGGEPPIIFKDFTDLKAKAAKGLLSPEIQFRETPKGSDDASEATYVVISAVRAYETNFETVDANNEGMGTLTYAACRAFANILPHTTYRGLFATIAAEVIEKKGGNQHPVIEGTGLNRELWGGDIINQEPFLTIRNLNEAHTEITVNGGTINGLAEGAKVDVYPAGTSQPNGRSELTTGTVTAASAITSTVVLDKPLSINQIPEAIVFVTEKVYLVRPIVLGFDKSYASSDIKAVHRNVADLPLITFVGAPNLILTHGPIDDSMFAVNGEAFFASAGKPARDASKLIKAIQDYAQYLVLRPLQHNDPEAHVLVKLVPILNGRADTGDIASIISKKCTNSGCVESGYAITAGMRIKIWLQNDGRNPVYVNVLDLQPDGLINALLPVHSPSITVEPHDLRLEPGQGAIFPPGDRQWINISPPYGTEVFKIFAIVDDNGAPLDLEGIATTRGVSKKSGGINNILQSLLRKSYGMRGAQMFSLPTDAKISVSDCVFEIIRPSP